MNKSSPLWPIWLAVLWVAAPLFWGSLFKSEYFLYGAHGLQKADISAPILFAIICWAILLSVPRFRIQRYICAAGGFLLAISFFFAYYKGFEHTGWLTLTILGNWLLSLPEPK
jgi:hypothetical protein